MFCNLQFSITIYSKAVEFEEEKKLCIEFLCQNGTISPRSSQAKTNILRLVNTI